MFNSVVNIKLRKKRIYEHWDCVDATIQEFEEYTKRAKLQQPVST